MIHDAAAPAAEAFAARPADDWRRQLAADGRKVAPPPFPPIPLFESPWVTVQRIVTLWAFLGIISEKDA